MWWLSSAALGFLVAAHLYLFRHNDSRPSTTRYCLRCNGTGRAARYPFGRSKCPLCDGKGVYLAVAVALTVALTGCQDLIGDGVVGHVRTKHVYGTTKRPKYVLTVNQMNGRVIDYPVSKAVYDRCAPGDSYRKCSA